MKENKQKSELHPLEPFLPQKASLLMLGSFPPPRSRWKMDFYYPNFQNDMWRIFGWVFFREKDYFLTWDRKAFCEEKIRSFLEQKGIALTDVGREVIRHQGNASDQFLEIVRPMDLEIVLEQLPLCQAVVTTGQKATDTLLVMVDALPPNVGEHSKFMFKGRSLRFYRMPSSSLAYPKPLTDKAEVYERMFRELNLCP